MSGHTCLRGEDAVELTELLEFLSDWIDHAHHDLAEALASFTGDGYTLGELRNDLSRFAFLLGGDADRFVHGAEQ